MVEEDLELRIFKVREPFEKPFLVSMGGESTQGMNMSLYCNLFSKEPDGLRSIDDSSPECPLGLVTDDHDMGCFPPEMVFQMVLDSSSLTHSAGTNDNPCSRILVDGFRFFR